MPRAVWQLNSGILNKETQYSLRQFLWIFFKTLVKDDQFDIFQFYLYLEEVDGVVKMVTTVDFTHVALKLKAFKNTG